MRRHTIVLAALPIFAFFPFAATSASADLQMGQKKHESEKNLGKDAKASDSTIRIRVAEGRLRWDYGDPVGFTAVERLDRRPGELISHLITPGDETYWTSCRPFVPKNQPIGPGDGRVARSPELLTIEDTGETKIINNFPARKYLLKGRLTLTDLVSEIWASTDVASLLEQYGLVWGVRMGRADFELRFGEGSKSAPEEMRTIKGFPVLINEIEQNQYVRYERRLELVDLKEEPIPPMFFDLPEGLTKKYHGAMVNPPVCED